MDVKVCKEGQQLVSPLSLHQAQSDYILVCKEAAMISLRKVFDSLESMNKGRSYTVQSVNSIYTVCNSY